MYEGRYEAELTSNPKHLKFVVVGSQYRVGYPGFLGSIHEGDPIDLVHAPDNAFDPYAVECWIDGVWVGFVPQKGESCLNCGNPIGWTHNGVRCCSHCDNSTPGLGGLAFRLVKQGLLEEAKAFVTAIDDDSIHQPIHGEIWIP